MNDYRIVFSVPVHEKWDVVLDLVLNFLQMNPQCAIVLHISKGFKEAESTMKRGEFETAIKKIAGVYINPQSVRTGFSDIIQAHISNFNYINTQVGFRYFSMCASNELFIKEGLYDHIKDYDCGIDFFFPEDKPKWIVGQYVKNDSDLKALLNAIGGGRVVASHIEGSFYSQSIFATIANLIESYYDYQTMSIAYPREEIYFSSILWSLIDKDTSIKILCPGLFTFVHWSFEYNRMNISISDVEHSRVKESPYYSVKRVARDLNSNIRVYIRHICGYECLSATLNNNIKQRANILLHVFDILISLKWRLEYIKNNIVGVLLHK